MQRVGGEDHAHSNEAGRSNGRRRLEDRQSGKHGTKARELDSAGSGHHGRISLINGRRKSGSGGPGLILMQGSLLGHGLG